MRVSVGFNWLKLIKQQKKPNNTGEQGLETRETAVTDYIWLGLMINHFVLKV